MFGLTVRWSLADAPVDVLMTLKEYVENESHSKFAGLDGLRFKSWRAREGEWFEGCYVFKTDDARVDFQKTFEAIADDSPGSTIIGSSPILIEPCEIVAVVRGPAGFRSASAFER